MAKKAVAKNKKQKSPLKHKWIMCAAIAGLLFVAGGSITTYLIEREEPLAHVAVPGDCRTYADKVLKANKSSYPFGRCEHQTYKTPDGKNYVTKVRVVAGTVEPQWEFECGFKASCAIYTGWFNSAGQLFDFVAPPSTANQDPSVYSLGCGSRNKSSIYDVQISPTLDYRDDSYWWKVQYNKTASSSNNPSCYLTGTSLIGHGEALSSVKADYLFDPTICFDDRSDTACQTAEALITKSADACKYVDGYTGAVTYDYSCVSNYISKTGEESLCGVKANFGTIKCDQIVRVKKL